MNLHIHALGDAAVRKALNAVEAARDAVGGELDSRVTLSHVELIADSDVPRFEELNVVANYTPHWHGEYGDGVSAATAGPLGPVRNRIKNRARLLQESGAVVTYSSDVIASVGRASPFLGVEVGHTRNEGPGTPVTPPADQRLTLMQLLYGYTLNAAYQFGWEERLGSIEEGKMADLVILDRDITAIDVHDIRNTMPAAVLLEGALVQGSFPSP